MICQRDFALLKTANLSDRIRVNGILRIKQEGPDYNRALLVLLDVARRFSERGRDLLRPHGLLL